jgi:hypothetical protein
MRLKAVVRFLRKDQIFHTGDAKIDRTFNSNKGQGRFPGFQKKLVEALYRKDNPCDGEVAVCIFELSTDVQFFPEKNWLIWFPKNHELKVISESIRKTDETTEDVLGRGWRGHPLSKLHNVLKG